MTLSVTASDLLLYAGALLILFLTPGPVWLAMIARSMSGGFQAAWPLALGVSVGDVLWPFIAILGVTWLVQEVSGFMTILRWVAVLIFLGMGAMLVLQRDAAIAENRRLTRPGKLAGFAAGVAVILANPKAILFYMGVLPGFFDVTRVTAADIAVICVLSLIVPLAGNLAFALLVDRIRGIITAPRTVRRLNLGAGILLIIVGLVIPFT